MKILYQCELFLPDAIGGIEVLAAQYLEAMRTRGHQVLVVATRFGSQPIGMYEYRGIPIIKLDLSQALAGRNLARMRTLLDEVHRIESEFKPDIVHLNDVLPSSFFFVRRGREARFPTLLTLHSPMASARIEAIQVKLIQESDVIVAVSNSQYSDAVALDPSIIPRGLVIHNALLEPGVGPLPLPFHPAVLLCVGRLVIEKGFDVALQAFAQVRKRKPGLQLVIAGDGNERKRLEALAVDYGVESDVSFRGWVAPDEIPDLINQSTMVLMPSRFPEPFGLVALQTAQMARPIIASRRGGLPEVVEDGVSGVLVPPEDPDAITAAVEMLLDSPDQASEMGSKARIRARDVFGFEKLLQAHEAAYLKARDRWASSRFGDSAPRQASI